MHKQSIYCIATQEGASEAASGTPRTAQSHRNIEPTTTTAAHTQTHPLSQPYTASISTCSRVKGL